MPIQPIHLKALIRWTGPQITNAAGRTILNPGDLGLYEGQPSKWAEHYVWVARTKNLQWFDHMESWELAGFA